MKKTNLNLSISLLALGLSSSFSAVSAEVGTEAQSIADAITNGKTNLSLRYRYEYVDADDGSREANASTLKTRLTFKTQSYKNASVTLEMDNNSVVVDDAYNDGTGGEEAVVKDPTYTEVNQAYLDYSAPENTLIRYGRQRVLLDNQRFIGGVGWRQNEQTYDALAIVNSSLPDTTLLFANVNNVNTITGANVNGKNHQLYNINNKSIDGLSLSAYFYALEDISDTYGLRADGKFKANDNMTVLYTAEFANQSTDNAADNETSYISLEGGVSLANITAKLGYELLGSDDGDAGFSTPLGTNHKFNGWADKFLATPANGLEDKYLSLSSKLLGPAITLTYHQFDSDEGSTDFGNEIDLAVTQKFTKNYSGTFKLADFSQGDDDGGKVDTTKIWLQLVAKF
jgi:hypothetical protein